MEKEKAPAPKPKKKPSGKAAPKKKAAGKKTGMKKTAAQKASSSKKKAPGRKTGAKKAAPKKKPGKKKAAPGAVAKRKPAAKPKAKKTAVSRKKPVSIRDLLAKKFDMPAPAKKYSPPSAGKGRATVSSPPFFTGETPEETKRVRRLLFKRFDVKPSEEEADAGSAPEPKPEPPKVAMQPTGIVAPLSEASGGEKAPAVSPSKRHMDSGQKIVSIGIGILALLLALVMWSSALNVGKYYMKTVSGEVEIWKGRFSPRGAEKIFTLDRTALPADLKEAYGKEEALPLIFEGIVNNTDALLNKEEMPGFDFIRRELTKARPYAVSDQMSDRLQRRTDKIDMMALVYKADVLAGKGTTADLKRARETLEKALALNLDEAEKGLVEQKIAWIDQKLL